ncbi:WD repeat-containing protein on Y chromosome-like isoform X4 [Clavelina lepadiformis]|uniref:WD repeat-containing protein on Y chromosome-like isoform X4 n=1 Tax=Clavelina lepadiformis TaxID=159417 RepID=UPI0040420CB6
MLTLASKTSKSRCGKDGKKHMKVNGKGVVHSPSLKRLDEDLDDHNLKELEEIFKEAARDDAGGLDMHQFRIAMKKTMKDYVDDQELDTIFMKVDTNCDGTVDWDEYLSYMLLEYQKKENMKSSEQDRPFPNPMLEKQSNHLESICRITMLTAYSRQNTTGAEIDDSSCRYLTLSKEGTFNIWSIDWVLQKSTTLESSVGKYVLLTDMVCLSNCNCVAVASTEYEISFYSLTSSLIQKKFQIIGLEHCALTMDFSFEVADQRKSILLWGDSNGCIYVMRMYEKPNICLYTSSSQPTISSLLKGNVPNVIVTKIPRVHPTWVQQVRYYVSKQGLECFVSCSVTDDKSLNFFDITPKVAGTIQEQHISINRSSTFRIRKGVLCLDYDPDWNLIVTGSRDCDVKMWNPFVVDKSSAVLKGHRFAVIQVQVRGGDHQIISVSKDKNIRVWDLRDYSCKQNIHGRNVNLGLLDVSAMYFNKRHKDLILATNLIGVFRPRNPSVSLYKRQKIKTHNKPISSVLYNPIFEQIVTGSDDATICIWDLKTGIKLMQFCAEVDVEITAMAFDPTNRRLATGLHNGSIALWNFNNGACLRRLKKTSNLEITSIVFCKSRIFSAGWDKNITVYNDSYDDESFRKFRRSHGDDVINLAHRKRDSVFASASYDGDIFVWSLDTEDVLVVLNMNESILPIHFGTNSSLGTKLDTYPTKGEIPHNNSEVKKKANAWTSSSVSPTINLPKGEHISSEETHNKKYSTNIGLWLPDYLPWVKERKFCDDSDSSKEYNDDASDLFAKQKKHNNTHANKAINKLHLLQERQSDQNTAVLLAAVSLGLVVAWSIHQKGGLLGYFDATQDKNEAVLAMESDDESELLMTGDSRGYIKMWDITSYCDQRSVLQRRNFFEANATHDSQKSSECCFVDGRFTRPTYIPFDQAPPLRWAIRGHINAVTSIAFMKKKALVATASTDCSVRLWSTLGRYIGTFGQKSLWRLQFPIKEKHLPVAIPEDIRRVGSPTSLRVIKGGCHAQWKQIKNAVNFVGKAGAFFHTVNPLKPKEEIKERFSEVNKILLQEISVKNRTSTSRKNSLTVWLDDSPHSISTATEPHEKIERTYSHLAKEGIQSSVLGQINYKPKKRHKKAQINGGIRWSDKYPIVYCSLPCHEIDPISEPYMPNYIRKKGQSSIKHANTVITRHRTSALPRGISSLERPISSTITKTLSPCSSLCSMSNWQRCIAIAIEQQNAFQTSGRVVYKQSPVFRYVV